MNITDILPIEILKDISGIENIGLITFIIFISGYLTTRIARKKQVIKINNGVDDIVLISVSGFIWFSRFFLFFIFALALSESLPKNHVGKIMMPLIVFMGFYLPIIIASLIDGQKFILNREKFLHKLGKRYKRLYFVFISIYPILWSGSFLINDSSLESFVACLMIILSMIPSLYLSFRVYKKIEV